MTCPDCHKYEVRLRELEERIGLSRRLSAIGAISDAFDCNATGARIILRLYRAGGLPVTGEALADELSSSSRKSVHVTVYKLRQQIGEGIIDSRNAGDEHGYWLTTVGMSRALAALEKPDFQDVRSGVAGSALELGGMRVVADPSIPIGAVHIIPNLVRRRGETDVAFRDRVAAATIRLVNVSVDEKQPQG